MSRGPAHGAATQSGERCREEEAKSRDAIAKLSSLEGVLRSLGEKKNYLQEQAAAATEGHHKQIEATAEARGAAEVLRNELAAVKAAAEAAASRAESAAAGVAARADAAEAELSGLRERLKHREAELTGALTDAAEVHAINAACEAAAAAAADETRAAKESEKEHRREAERLREKLDAEKSRTADAEGQAMLWAAELEECRWREAAAGTHATAMEEKAHEFESKVGPRAVQVDPRFSQLTLRLLSGTFSSWN